MSQNVIASRVTGFADVLRLTGSEDIWARLQRQPKPSPVLLYWVLFSASASMAIIHFFIEGHWAALETVLAFGSCVTCGFGWLLSRSLFRPEPKYESWPIAFVAVLFLMVATLLTANMVGVDGGPLVKITGSLASLLSSAVLVLTSLEAIEGASRRTTGDERRFQFAFLAGYGALLSGGVILFRSSLDIPGLENWKDAGQTFCAGLALIGAAAATRYRLKHPLLSPDSRPKRSTPMHDFDPLLRDRIAAAMVGQRAFLEADLKVADLAARLGAPEYKVSQCITSGMGFANFNQLLNHHRIEEAKRRLSDRAESKVPILTIALESGFGSVGPFNRAFKARVGMTPGAFRSSALS